MIAASSPRPTLNTATLLGHGSAGLEPPASPRSAPHGPAMALQGSQAARLGPGPDVGADRSAVTAVAGGLVLTPARPPKDGNAGHGCRGACGGRSHAPPPPPRW